MILRMALCHGQTQGKPRNHAMLRHVVVGPCCCECCLLYDRPCPPPAAPTNVEARFKQHRGLVVANFPCGQCRWAMSIVDEKQKAFDRLGHAMSLVAQALGDDERKANAELSLVEVSLRDIDLSCEAYQGFIKAVRLCNAAAPQNFQAVVIDAMRLHMHSVTPRPRRELRLLPLPQSLP